MTKLGLLCCVLFILCSDTYGLDTQTFEQNSLYTQLNAQAAIMTGLIKKYQNSGTLSDVDQQEYVTNLYSFLLEAQSMHNVESNVAALTDLDEKFQKVYLAWTDILITNQSLRAEINDLHMYLMTKTDANRAVASKGIDLYKQLADLIVMYEEVFEKAIDQSITNATSYSVSNKNALIQSFNDAYLNFYRSVNAALTAVRGEYVLFLQDQDSEFDPSHLSSQEQKTIESMDTLVHNAQSALKAFLVDLTSKQVKANVVKQLQDSFALSHTNLMDLYQKQLYANEQNLSQAWWKELKLSAKELMAEFKVQFKNEAKKQVQLAMLDQVSGLAGQSSVYVSNSLSPTVNKSLETMSETLKTQSWQDFEKAASIAQQIVAQSIQASVPVAPPVKPIKVNLNNTVMSADEKTFRKVRLKNYVQPALKKLGIEQPLNIALCCSGGGVRSMFGTLGIMSAAAQYGILQATMYIAGVSGSTWAIAPWTYLYLIGKIGSHYQTSLDMLQKNLIQGLNPEKMYKVPSTGMYTPARLKAPFSTYFAYQVAVRLAYKQNLALVDLFGALVANFAMDLVGDYKLNATWSSVASTLRQSGSVPLPLCTAVYDAQKPSQAGSLGVTSYAWVEMNPFHVSVQGAGQIPWKYFGSVFKRGVLDHNKGSVRPEYPISYVLGICASLFALHPDDLQNQDLSDPQFSVSGYDIVLPVNGWISDVVKLAIGQTNVERRHKMMSATIANFSQGVAGSSITKNEDIRLIDGGIACNFPLPVLFDKKDRNLDIVFIYDSHPGDVNAFKQANEYCIKNKLNVPNFGGLSAKILTSDTLVVFNDPRKNDYKSTQPTLIYIPTMVDISGVPYTTFNFGYTEQEVNTLIDTVSKKFSDNVDDIKDIMKLVAQKRVVNTSL